MPYREGLEHAGEVAYLRSQTDLTAEIPYFDFDTNLQAFYDSVLGTKMETEVDQLTTQKGEDGKRIG